jgi:ATP-binding cassette, subfamily B, multidrug efflux pump
LNNLIEFLKQEELGKINGFVQEMMAGQKVEKVFNHEEKDYRKFCEMNENFRKESTNALAFAGMMIPTIVSLSYLSLLEPSRRICLY